MQKKMRTLAQAGWVHWKGLRAPGHSLLHRAEQTSCTGRAVWQPYRELHASILERGRRGLTMREIARQIAGEIKARGLENCPRKHIVVVQEGKAFYLDNALPHTRRWQAAGFAVYRQAHERDPRGT